MTNLEKCIAGAWTLRLLNNFGLKESEAANIIRDTIEPLWKSLSDKEKNDVKTSLQETKDE